MGPWHQGWTVVLVVLMGFMAAAAENEPHGFGDGDNDVRPVVDGASEAAQSNAHHRSRRQLLDGWRPLRESLSALENVDELLRTTVPDMDRLQCLERFMCEMSSGSIMQGINEFMNPSTPPPLLPLPQPTAQFPTFQGQNPAFQQGFQQHPQAQFQQHPQAQFQQHPQAQFQQRPQAQFQQHPQAQFQQQPQAQFQQHPQAQPSQFQQFQQPQHGFPQQAHPQSLAQQGFPPNQAFQQPQQPQHFDPSQVQQQFDPTFQQGGFVNNPGFQQFPSGHPSQQVPAHQFSQFRESSSTDENTIRREGEIRPISTRPLHRRKKPQRSGLMSLIDNLFGGRTKRSALQTEKTSTINKTEKKEMEDSISLSRKKRGLFDSVLNTFNAFSPDMMLRLVDQYMIGQQNSLYPYTHASMMGYTGSPQRCERLYPTCPTNPDEMIHTFNNIRRYYPDGLPFADQLPAFMRDLFK